MQSDPGLFGKPVSGGGQEGLPKNEQAKTQGVKRWAGGFPIPPVVWIVCLMLSGCSSFSEYVYVPNEMMQPSSGHSEVDRGPGESISEPDAEDESPYKFDPQEHFIEPLPFHEPKVSVET